MGSFLRKGYRKVSNRDNKLIRKHTKDFYKTLHKLDGLAVDLIRTNDTITDDNIQEHVNNIWGRDLDDMEKTIVLSKLADWNARTKDKEDE